MKIVEPFARLESEMTGQTLIEKIARAARTSHKSAGKGYAADCALVAKLIGWGHTSVLEHVSLSATIRTDRAIANELTRHRLCAFTQESTRYVDYTGGGIEVIRPHELRDDKTKADYMAWFEACVTSELAYKRMRENGASPETARSVLPLCTATTLRMTANLREWRHIFRLRCGKAAHPDIRLLCGDLLRQVRELVPVVFDDLEADA